MPKSQKLSWIKTELHNRKIKPQKKFGQNFLIDNNILEFIIDNSEICRNDIVLEIGAGTGILTQLIAQKAKHVFAVEIDGGLYEFAKENLAYDHNVKLINKDALKDKSHIEPEIVAAVQEFLIPSPESDDRDSNSKPVLKVVSNLPYSISTPIIINILQSDLPVETMILTLQKEITHRLLAQPGTKDYGILSIIAQYFCEIEILKFLSPGVFWPIPKIESAIVKLRVFKKEQRIPLTNYDLFIHIVKAIFGFRRKTINNSLSKVEMLSNLQTTIPSILETVNIEARTRGESLSIKQIIELTNELDKFLAI